MGSDDRRVREGFTVDEIDPLAVFGRIDGGLSPHAMDKYAGAGLAAAVSERCHAGH